MLPIAAQILPDLVVKATGRRYQARLAEMVHRMRMAPRSNFIDREDLEDLQARSDWGFATLPSDHGTGLSFFLKFWNHPSRNAMVWRKFEGRLK